MEHLGLELDVAPANGANPVSALSGGWGFANKIGDVSGAICRGGIGGRGAEGPPYPGDLFGNVGHRKGVANDAELESAITKPCS
jgi:hypothetical protein